MLLTDVWIACDTKYNMMTIKYIVFTYIAFQHLGFTAHSVDTCKQTATTKLD